MMTDPPDDRRDNDDRNRDVDRTEVPAGVQSVDEGLPNDELPDDETIVRDTQSE
ncbi:hypothetical protein [Agromyces sp. Marseille-Q5079]|uniref:hypothetical protein n=1 Tax=Agromyces sp. Marseille-Q5079 TaxID=3439059 RepID=UPI003D9C8C40